MTDADKSFVIRLFACVSGLPVDMDKFYGLIGPPFFFLLGSLLTMVGANKLSKETGL